MMRHRLVRSTIDILLAVALAGAVAANANAAFDCGSDGSDLDITLAAGEGRTVDVPPDGILNLTTLTVGAGAVLSFRRNAFNTPVYILCTGNVLTSGGSLITVAGSGSPGLVGGAGGPGGWNGGDAVKDSFPAGDGQGPGGGTGLASGGTAGRGNHAGLPDPVANDGAMYGGPLLLPLTGGSGGGGNYWGGGGGGGGAILIASNTSIRLDGTIDARGGGNGAGGSIRLVAPVVSGTGTLNVDMGTAAGKGRLRVDTLDPFEIRFNWLPVAARTVGTVMVVFPPADETLEIARIGSQVIAPGSEPPTVILPDGAPTSQEIEVRATRFTGSVPVAVVLTPRHGPRSVYPATITMGGNTSATTTVQAVFAINMPTRVDVWTREP